jgi:hypothetical protein
MLYWKPADNRITPEYWTGAEHNFAQEEGGVDRKTEKYIIRRHNIVRLNDKTFLWPWREQLAEILDRRTAAYHICSTLLALRASVAHPEAMSAHPEGLRLTLEPWMLVVEP